MISVFERYLAFWQGTSTFGMSNVSLLTAFLLIFKQVLLYSEAGLIKETQINSFLHLHPGGCHEETPIIFRTI